MRKRTLGVVLLAGLALSGAGAFTASNTVTAIDNDTTPNSNIAGYGAATVSGATVLSIDYIRDSADASLIDEVKFVADGDVASKEAAVVFWLGSTNNGSYSCTGALSDGSLTILGVSVAAGDTVFTCATPDEPIAGFDTIGITVNN